ncbi:MAG: hypothetical protein AAF653_18965 [Chloroflexota bacterium]
MGAKVVVTGDIARTDNILHEIDGANTLVIESTFLDEDAGAAKAFGHITAKQAAQFAKEAGVQKN